MEEEKCFKETKASPVRNPSSGLGNLKSVGTIFTLRLKSLLGTSRQKESLLSPERVVFQNIWRRAPGRRVDGSVTHLERPGQAGVQAADGRAFVPTGHPAGVQALGGAT